MDLKKIKSYWLETSDDSLDTSLTLYKNKKYNHSMFFLHLAIEKLLKALYVHTNKKEAPIGHNLINLTKKINKINFNENTLEELAQITTFNIASRYDDYKQNFYKICNKEFADNYLKIGKEIIKWLKSQII